MAGHAEVGAAGAFAPSYAQARAKFQAAADAAGLDLQPHPHPMLGRDGEALAMDVARFGPLHAERLLLVTSGCHGVEGFCGSGVQVALLSDPAWHAAARAAGVAVLYVHALNPYGFSWLRRATHENVDLNRNFLDFSQPLPANETYDRLAHLVVPPTWPPAPEVEAALQAFVAEKGEKALQAAITGGQYKHPDGLIYGGHDPTWSQQTLRHVLQEHGTHCRRLGWIDVHTGLGPGGKAELICAGRGDAALARARAWWGPQVTSIEDGSSSSAPVSGTMWRAAEDECPQAEVTGIALEVGTLPIRDVLDALRAEQWLENHPEVAGALHDAIKRRLRDAFYTDTDAWKERVVEQAFGAARQAVAGLSRQATR